MVGIFLAIATAKADVRHATRYATSPGAPALRVVARVTTGDEPKSVSVSPDGRRLYVAVFGDGHDGAVRVHDAATLAPLGAVHFDGGAVESVLSPDGATLYVSNFARQVLAVIDTRTLAVTAEVHVGSNPKVVALSPDGRTAYVANWSDRFVSVVDLAMRHEVRRLPTGLHPRGMAVAHDGTLYVAAFRDDVVHVFRPGAYRESRRFRTCRLPRHLVLSPDESRLDVSCTIGAMLVAYDPRTGHPRGASPTGNTPRTVARSADGRYLAVANFRGGSVTLVDIVARTHSTSPILGASQIVGLAIRPTGSLRIYATSWLTDELVALEP